MREKLLHLLGLMRRANALAVGETNTGSCARAGKAELLLIAGDASGNARRRAEGFAAGHQTAIVELPFTKEEFASAVGLSGGSMAAITDLGFACALLRGLAELEPERYGAAREELEKRRERRQARQSARNTRIGKRRTNG